MERGLKLIWQALDIAPTRDTASSNCVKFYILKHTCMKCLVYTNIQITKLKKRATSHSRKQWRLQKKKIKELGHWNKGNGHMKYIPKANLTTSLSGKVNKGLQTYHTRRLISNTTSKAKSIVKHIFLQNLFCKHRKGKRDFYYLPVWSCWYKNKTTKSNYNQYHLREKLNDEAYGHKSSKKSWVPYSIFPGVISSSPTALWGRVASYFPLVRRFYARKALTARRTTRGIYKRAKKHGTNLSKSPQ